MSHARPRHTAEVARWVAVAVAVVLLLLAASSLALVNAIAPGLFAQYAGLTVTESGGVRIVGRQMSPRTVGDRTLFTLTAGEGSAFASALPIGYPVPMGASIVRSAAYRDARHSYRGAVAEVPVGPIEISEWYRAALVADGWAVASAVDTVSYSPGAAPIVASRGDLVTRVEFAAGSLSAGPSSAGSALSSDAAPTSIVGAYVTGP